MNFLIALLLFFQIYFLAWKHYTIVIEYRHHLPTYCLLGYNTTDIRLNPLKLFGIAQKMGLSQSEYVVAKNK